MAEAPDIIACSGYRRNFEANRDPAHLGTGLAGQLAL